MKQDESVLKIGLGGYSNGELITFDYCEGEKLKPYVCAILGRDFTFVFKREFVTKNFSNFKIDAHDTKMQMVSFKIQPYVVYEYKRFAGFTLGEILEGYFVIVKNRVIELDYEEVRHWCGTTKEKMNAKSSGRAIFSPDAKKYVADDVDF